MKITKAIFIESNTNHEKCPGREIPEYAFIGRSNVGKSSLINMLTNNNKLAKTSNKPGKTSLINHFEINDNWYLVDLPGYGWAQVSKKQKAEWNAMTRDYLKLRRQLVCTFVLIDVRHEAQKVDLEFMRWLGENEIPFIIIFTKADKISRNEVQSSISKYRKKMMQFWEEMPHHIVTSSQTSMGKEELLHFISDLNSKL